MLYKDKPPHIKRQIQLINKYPSLSPLVMKDSLVRAWFEGWSRTENTAEEGLIDLILHLQKEKKMVMDDYISYIRRNPTPVLKSN